MCCPKRFFTVFMAFLGRLICNGYASSFSIAMVHIVKSDSHLKEADPKFLGFYCSVNTSLDVSDHWTISSTQYLHSAYYLGIFSTQLLGGYLASRFSPKKVCGISALISSILLLALPTAIQVNYVMVYVIRIFQGIVEGISFPAVSGVVSAWTPNSEKSRMMTVLSAGGTLSPAVAFAVSGITSCVVTWSASLYIYVKPNEAVSRRPSYFGSGCGCLWSVIWLMYVCDTPSQHPGLSQNEKLLFEREGPRVVPGSMKIAKKIPWSKLFASLPMWALLVSSFCRNWIYSYKVMGIPQYFKVAFTTNIAEIGLEAALPSLLVTITMIIGGVLIDKVIKSRLVSTTVGRKIAQCIGFGVEGFCFIGLRYIERQEIALIVLYVGIAWSGLSASGYQVNALDLAPQYVGILTGFYRLGTIGSVLNTAVTGKLNPKTIDVWQNISTMSGSGLLVSVVFYGIFASGERQNWIEDPENKSLINQTPQEQEESETKT